MKIKWRYLYSTLLVFCSAVFFISAIGDDNEEHLPQYYVNQAKGYFIRNQWDLGKTILDTGLKNYPDDPDMRWLMGKYYYQFKNYDQSRYQLIKCIDKEYNHIQAKQLLVNVEEETRHYSSAICYVNELLEINPYWRGLWRRKIELYRKQGNDVEADRLLKRISQIYPDDPTLRRDLAYTLENNYYRLKKLGDQKSSMLALEELMKSNPHNEGFYLELANLYLQQGLADKALETTVSGSQEFPSSMSLVSKRVGILSEQFRFQEAMAILKDKMKKSNSSTLRRMYNDILQQQARAARDSDPYILYGKIYAMSKSKEALDFLLSTSLTRGYYEDARFYLKEAKKRYGANNKKILYKEYMLALRMGDTHDANGLLQNLYEQASNDADIVDAMCTFRLNEADKYMINDDWAEALPHVRFVVRKSAQNKEIHRAALEKMLTCLTEMKRYNEALLVLDTVRLQNPEYTSFINKKAGLLDKMGRTNEALDIYYQAYRDSSDLNKELYASAYEEIAVPYIKRLIQSGETRQAYIASTRLLEVDPQSDLGLHYAINTSAALKRYDEFDKFTNLGIGYYPNDIFYKVKYASMLDRKKRYSEALNLLHPELSNYLDSPELIGAHSQSSESLALQMLKSNKNKSAMQILDTALSYDENNKELLYAKGLVYEKMHQYDSAYVYQKKYQPAITDVSEYNQHLKGLQNRTFKNEIRLEYLHARFANQDIISSISTLEYSRSYAKNIYTGRINYKGSDGTSDGDSIIGGGGTGIQLQGEWMHRFTPTLSGMFNAAWGSKYFSTIVLNAQLTKQLKNEWETSIAVGYRKLAESSQYVVNNGHVALMNGHRNLFMLSPSLAKYFHPVWASAKLDLLTLSNNYYYNLSGQAKFFLNDDGRTNIQAMAGIGTFPEISVVDYSLIRNFSHTNTMVGLGGQWLVNKYLTLGILGTWYTYYNYRYSYDNNFNLISTTQYRNLYNVYFQLNINF